MSQSLIISALLSFFLMDNTWSGNQLDLVYHCSPETFRKLEFFSPFAVTVTAGSDVSFGCLGPRESHFTKLIYQECQKHLSEGHCNIRWALQGRPENLHNIFNTVLCQRLLSHQQSFRSSRDECCLFALNISTPMPVFLIVTSYENFQT